MSAVAATFATIGLFAAIYGGFHCLRHHWQQSTMGYAAATVFYSSALVLRVLS